MPLIPDKKPPAALTVWPVTFEGGQIICRPHAVTGRVRLFEAGRHEVPPEWLARAIPLTADLEDEPCR